MDMNISVEEHAFRHEVSAFARANLPKPVRNKVLFGEKLAKAEYVDWQQRLYRQGWIAPSWPVEYGGTGWSLAKRRVFQHALVLCCAPETISFGISMIGPVLYTFGSDAQKAKYLAGILKSETWWCQGFSEPNAGSDLASLKTRARDRGDHYVVSGQKTWTTHGRHADMMFCLARTTEEAKLQNGISFLLLDMKAPGVEVRPIETIDEGASICEVFLDDVVVAKSELVGVEGRGWDYAKFLLGKGKGFDGATASMLKIEGSERAARGIQPRSFSEEDIVHFYMAALVNEAAKVLGDGIALRPLDIDVAMVHGYGFPRWRGGRMHYADTVGPHQVLADIRAYEQQDPLFWKPASLLIDLVARGPNLNSLNQGNAHA